MSILDRSAAAGHAALDPIAATIKNPFSTTVNNNGARPADFPDGFEITEYVEGQSSSYLQLVGNFMPMQPFPWQTEQRIAKEYYPGNPEAVGHMLGVKQGDLTIRGRFKDKRFKDPAYYGVSYQFALALDELVKRGNLLKFGFEGPAGKWIRWGFLEKTDFKMNKLSMVDYELTFFVVSDTQPVNNYFAADEKQAPSSVNFNLINAATDFNANYSSVPTSVPSSIADKMNQLINGVAQNVNLVTNFVQTIITTAGDVAASANRALGLIKNARASISKMGRDIDNVAHTFTSLSTATAPAQRTRDTYRNFQYLHEARAATVPMSAYLAQMQAMFTALAQQIPKARYRVKDGDTLQNISMKFYGSADYWSKIYDHNRLQTTVLVNGTVLEIPKL